MFFRIPQKAFPIISCSVLLVLALCRSVVSHPHMWIDLKSEIVFNKESNIVGIYQEWLFDDFYSVALLEDAAQHPDGVEKGLRTEISQILAGLHSWNYFTQIMVGTNEVQAKQVQQFETELRGNRVWLSFTTQLEAPASPTTEAFSYSIFDPTYYIEMYHFDDAIVALRGSPPKGCKSEIQQADPSSEAIALSQSPVLDAQPDVSVGELFAETVAVVCS